MIYSSRYAHRKSGLRYGSDAVHKESSDCGCTCITRSCSTKPLPCTTGTISRLSSANFTRCSGSGLPSSRLFAAPDLEARTTSGRSHLTLKAMESIGLNVPPPAIYPHPAIFGIRDDAAALPPTRGPRASTTLLKFEARADGSSDRRLCVTSLAGLCLSATIFSDLRPAPFFCFRDSSSGHIGLERLL